MEISFLQSDEWAKFQRSLGRETIMKSGDGWSYLAIVEHGRLGRRLFCPYGPSVKSKTALLTALKDLKTEAKKRRLDFIRVEPRGEISATDLREIGLRPSHRSVNPPDTVISDVRGTPDEVTARLSQTARRYARKADKAGVTYRVSYEPTDIRLFLEMIHDVAARTGMRPHSDFYFQHIAASLFPDHSAGMLIAEIDGVVIASIIFYTDGETMTYAHAGNLSEYRKISPAYGLGLQALLFANEQGCKWFDWFGVAPEGASDDHRWSGFTQFKLAFGGKRQTSVGTWEIAVRRARYTVYKTALKLARKG